MANGQRLVKPKITALLVIIELHIKTQMGYHVNYSYIKNDKDVERKDLLHKLNGFQYELECKRMQLLWKVS